MGYPVGEDPRLAGARAGDDENRSAGVLYGLTLNGVQPREMGLVHSLIIEPLPSASPNARHEVANTTPFIGRETDGDISDAVGGSSGGRDDRELHQRPRRHRVASEPHDR